MDRIFGNKYIQEDHTYVSTVLPMKYIIENSEVLIYGENEMYGYQRAPKRPHYLKIANQLLSGEKKSVSPNSIVLGINEDDFEKKFRIENEEEGYSSTLLEMSVLANKKTKFRIIDGQHRVKGFQEAIYKCSNAEDRNKLENFQVNVIIMLVNRHQRIAEVYAFSDINSKAKPLKMDLTILAEYQYLLLEQPEDINNAARFLGTTIITLLNSGRICKNWFNGIVIDTNASKRIGCVGFKAFYESIEPLCKRMVSNIIMADYPTFQQKKNKLFELAGQVATQLGKAWDYVFIKWPVTHEMWVEEGSDEIKTYYNEQYYIQRTMGVYAFNGILCKCLEKPNGMDVFFDIIRSCTLSLQEWSTKGIFSGISSQSGVKKIKERILQDYISRGGDDSIWK